MKNLKLFEDFVDAKIKKPGFFGKMISGAKHAIGMEKKEDREALDSIYRAIKGDSEYMASGSKDRWINNVREIKPGVIIGYIDNNSMTVDQTVPEILYKGVPLDLHNIEEEVESLYQTLKENYL
jgi:hypothetical protein